MENKVAAISRNDLVQLPGLVREGWSKVRGSMFEDALKAAGADQYAASPAKYTIKRGDNLSVICRDHLKELGRSPSGSEIHKAVQEVARVNGIRNPDLIMVGQKLDLSTLAPRAARAPARAVTHVKTAARPQRTSHLAQGSTVSAAIARPSGETTDIAQLLHTLLDSTGGQGLAVARAVLTPGVSSSGQVKAALEANPWDRLLGAEGRLSSGYGMRKDPFTGRPAHHNGIDIAAKTGSTIYPFRAGKVTFSGRKAGYGNSIVVRHADGVETVYAHNSKNLAKSGQWVSPRTPIGKVGSSGRSTGPHLHFEVRRNGAPIDPMRVLKPRSFQVAKAL